MLAEWQPANHVPLTFPIFKVLGTATIPRLFFKGECGAKITFHMFKVLKNKEMQLVFSGRKQITPIARVQFRESVHQWMCQPQA